MAKNGKNSGLIVLVIFIILALAGGWLSRWKYQGTQLRENRFTSERQMRIEYDDGSHEWIPDYRAQP